MFRIFRRRSRRWSRSARWSWALCDVDTNQATAVAKQFAGNPKVPDLVTDFRRVLDRKDVQVIVNATGDHWHTLINLGAASAHEDIYAEKPLTLTVDEGSAW